MQDDEAEPEMRDERFDPWRNAVETLVRASKLLTVIGGVALLALIGYLVSVFGWPARHNAVVTEGIRSMAVADWHDAGYRGQGMKIGVIATGFAGYKRLVYRELPGYWSVEPSEFGWPPKDLLAEGERGTALGEILHDIAPGADLAFLSCLPNVDDVIEALRSQTTVEPNVVLLSCDLGGALPADDVDRIERWIARMRKHRYLVVVPASDSCNTIPCCLPSALTVSAIVGDTMLPYEDSSQTPDFVAPGTAPTVTYGRDPIDDEETVYPFAGADVAAAHVAAVAGLVWQAFPELTTDELEAYLTEHAEDLGEPGFDSKYGYGFVRLPAPPREAGSSSAQR